MRLHNQSRITRPQTIRAAIFLVLVPLFLIAGVPEARADTWNRNQTFQCGHSPAVIPSTYDTPSAGNCAVAVCPGNPVNITYGIQDPVGNSAAVSLKITIPPSTSFTVTSIKALKFTGGTGTGVPLSTQPTVATLPNFSIGALGALDKVIVVIDGYFLQASAYSATFVASRAGVPDESSPLNMDARCIAPPIDISIDKQVKASGGAFGSTASVAFGSTVTYKLTVKNASAPKPDGSTDLYLANLLKVQDQLSGTSTNDVPVGYTASNFQCTPSAGGVACPTMPTGSPSGIIYGANVNPLLNMTYPASGAGSDGFLPAQGSFVITFDVLIQTSATCSRGQNNKLNNVGYVIYSNGTSTIADQNPANNTSPVTTVTLTGLIATPCPTPTAIPALQVTKALVSPTGTGVIWGATFTYEITITNNSGTAITDFGVADYLSGTGTPPFTANFLASNVTCTPACTTTNNIAPATAAPLVGASFTSLFSGIKFSLGVGQTLKIKYDVKYSAPPCAAITTAGSIANYAYITGGQATGAGRVDTPMPALKKCDLDVSKKQTSGPTSFASYPQTLGYKVQFKNNSATDTINVGTLIDAIALDSPTYGNVPVSYSYTCTATGVTGVSPLTKAATTGSIQYANHPWGGIRLIDFESSPGAVFSPGGIVDCDLSVTLQQPSTTDSLCQGAGSPHLKNSAFIDLVYGFNPNQATQPVWYQEVTTPLPYCVSIITRKEAPANVQAGGPVTFTLTVTNVGKDPLSSVVLHDSVPPDFTNVTWTCASGCSAGSGSGNNINVPLTPAIASGATVTILVHATAPTELKAYCNDDKATFEPFPPSTYFEGDQAALTAAQACIQVIPSEHATPTPTPTPTAKPGCADVADKEIKCLPGGGYTYTFNVVNNSGSPISQILLTPVGGGTFSLSPQLTNLSKPLQNGQSTTVTVNIGNAKPGDKVCFFASLMSDQAACCIVQVCPTLPVCGEYPTPKPR